MKKLLTLLMAGLLAVVACFSLTACGKKDDLAAVKEKGVLYVGVTVYAGVDEIDSVSGEWVGFDADMANLFGEEIGVDVRFTIINWDNKVLELNGNYIDLIWNGMTASDELGEKIDFSVAYATNYQCAVVKSTNTSITNEATIKAATIAVEKGSAGDSVATETLKVTPNRVTAQIDALTEVLSGTSDVALVDYTLASGAVGKGSYANLKIVDGVKFEDEVFAVGARKGSTLVPELNKFFKKYYDNGKMAELVSKYDNTTALNTSALDALN